MSDLATELTQLYKMPTSSAIEWFEYTRALFVTISRHLNQPHLTRMPEKDLAILNYNLYNFLSEDIRDPSASRFLGPLSSSLSLNGSCILPTQSVGTMSGYLTTKSYARRLNANPATSPPEE